MLQIALRTAQGSAEIQPVTFSGFAVALVGVAGVVLGALIAGVVRLVGDRTARRAQAQRIAAHDLQEAALDLRRAYRRWRRLGPRPSDKVVNEMNEAQSRMDVVTERLDDAALRTKVGEWRALTRAAGLGDEDAKPADERQAWGDLNRELGVWLRKVDRPLLRRGE